MSESVEKKILLTLEINADSVRAGLEKTTQSVELLKKEQKELQAQLKSLEASNQSGTATWNKVREQLVSVTTSLQVAKKEQAQYQLQSTKTIQANQAEEGSLNQKRAALSAANQEYARASAEAKKTDAATIQLGQDIRKLTDELKAEEAALGNTFRNVGNYPKTIDGLNDKLNELNNTIRGVAIGSEEFEKIRDEIGKVETQLLVANGKFDEFGQKISKNKTKETLNDINDSITGVVAGFQLMNLVGAENEDTQKQIAQATKAAAIIQATQATLLGIEAGLGLITNTIKGARNALLATEIAQTQGLTVATFAQAAAQAVLNAVMNANPVMLIIGGVVALTAALVAFFGGTSKAEKEQAKLNKTLGDQSKILETQMADLQSASDRRMKVLQAEHASELKMNEEKLASAKQLNDKRQEQIANDQERTKVLLQMYRESDDEDKKKEYMNELNQIKEHRHKLIEETKDYYTEKIALEKEKEDIIAENKKRSRSLEIAAIRNDRKREREELKSQMEEELKDVSLSEQDKQNIREKYANQLLDKQKAWAKEDQDKKRKAVEDETQLVIEKTKEGSEARLNAQKAQIEKLRDLDLKGIGVTETQKQLIKLEADKKLEELEKQRQERARQYAEEEIELENRKTRAIDEAAELSAKTPEEKLAARLQIVHDEMTMSLQALQTKANEEKRLAEESITDAEERKKRLVAIEEARSAEELAIMKKSAEQIATETTAYKVKQLDQQLADDAILLGLAEGKANQENAIREDMLEKNYLKEVETAKAAGKDTSLITLKYEKDKQKLHQATQNAQLDAVKNTLGEAAALFGKNTVAFKALSVAQATINTYQAATAALASGSKLSPTFGIISASVAVATGLANIAKILNVNPEQKYEGGYTGDGNPREESLALGRKSYIYHKREYVTPAWLVEHPVGSRLVATLEGMRRSRGTSVSIGGFYDGGFADSSSVDRVSSGVSDSYSLQNAFSVAMTRLPNPVVFVEDINSGQSTVAKVASRANI